MIARVDAPSWTFSSKIHISSAIGKASIPNFQIDLPKGLYMPNQSSANGRFLASENLRR